MEMIIVGAVVVVLIVTVLIYNGLVRNRNRVQEAWADVDAQLERRHDLIPNLISTVKQYAAHEKQTLMSVTEARAEAEKARVDGGPAAAGQAEAVLARALGPLIALAESYPQLRASENFLELQQQLGNTEDQIAAARRIYNGNVQVYNTRCQSFPGLFIARPTGFAVREFFELSDPAKANPVMV